MDASLVRILPPFFTLSLTDFTANLEPMDPANLNLEDDVTMEIDADQILAEISQNKQQQLPELPTKIKDQIFGCGFCPSYFTNVQSLQVHQDENHKGQHGIINVRKVVKAEDKGKPQKRRSPGEAGLHECDQCGKKFSKNTHLRRHEKKIHLNLNKDRIQVPKIDFCLLPEGKCPLCEKEFGDSADELKSHMKSEHTPFEQCKSCKRPVRKGDIKFHLRGKHGFINIDEISNEMLEIHFENIEITCPICKEIIENKDDLKQHLDDQHEKYACHLCKKLFNYKKNVALHIKGIHENPHGIGCSMCDYKTNFRTDFRKHFNNKHPDMGPVSYAEIMKFAITTTPDKNKDADQFYFCEICGHQASSELDFKEHIGMS